MDRNNRFLTLCAVLLLCAAAVSASPCTGATTLCLSAQRFGVSVQWKDFQGNTGQGQAVGLTADTGYFWFFSTSNIELIVKVLDARAINSKFWVFFGALSNVEYTLTVTDSVTGFVKRYQNPSGQFASVGDTSAFDGSASSVAAADETVTTRGTASPPSSIADIQRFIEHARPSPAASAPCPGPATTLSLSNCRFAVEVAWTDPQSNEGSGQAVQLSADTGYFWFFNDSNVELMVKVLDARPINGQFWVFFGALSNVEYTITVTDTVSGALHTYHNPASTFASVGDTQAFRGGYGISVQLDASRAVNGTIVAAAGGALSATAADGTVFTLTVAASALLDDQPVTMTPVQATGAFPFAGGLAAGVELEPKGLVLLTGATLSVHTPTPISRSAETPVAWNGSGEDFFLFPPKPAGGDLELFLTHFGGYGVARGTDAERTAQLAREPIQDDDRFAHRVSPFLRQGRVDAPAARLSQTERPADIDPRIKAALDETYQTVYREGMLTTDGNPSAVLDWIEGTLAWKKEVEYWYGPLDALFPGRTDEIQSLFTTIVKRALAWIHDRCKQNPDAIADLRSITAVAEQLSLPVTLDVENVLDCLTFTLQFQSTLTITEDSKNGVFRLTHVAFAQVPLETQRFPNGLHFTLGQGTLDFTTLSAFGVPSECSQSHSSTPTPFKAIIAWTNLTRGEHLGFQVGYDFGFPPETITVTCDDQAVPFANFWWGEYYVYFVGTRNTSYDTYSTYPFFRSGWTRTGAKNPWATSHASQSDRTTSIDADFKLIHTPK